MQCDLLPLRTTGTKPFDINLINFTTFEQDKVQLRAEYDPPEGEQVELIPRRSCSTDTRVLS